MTSTLLTLLAQIGAILILARSLGRVFRVFRQPPVMGEIVAGLLLGPSCLGWLAPGLFVRLFPPDSLGVLNALGQLGALLFMFLVGLKLDLQPSSNGGTDGRAVLLISHASVAVPLILGGALALLLYPRLSGSSVNSTIFVLFIGGAMGVTALPVLARILEETGFSRHRLAAIALTAAAVNDVIAWSFLAVVTGLATHGHGFAGTALTLAGSGLFVGTMVTAGRAGLRRLAAQRRGFGGSMKGLPALMLLTAAGSAWIADWLGLHAFFGAFLAGAVMPRDKDLTAKVSGRLEQVTTALLLPLFFASTGLKTSLGLIAGADLWLWFGCIMIVAVAGMFGGTAVAARFAGMTWSEAATIGILMNTRGMMELLILSIGRDVGIISPTLFAMMVMMALATTLMTAPLLRWWRLRCAPDSFELAHGHLDLSKSL